MSNFKVRLVSSIVWPVSAPVPVAGGDVDEHEFFVKFKMKTADEYSELLEQGDMAMLREVVEGIGESEDEVAEDKESLEQIIPLGYYRLALYNAYNAFLIGVKAKN